MIKRSEPTHFPKSIRNRKPRRKQKRRLMLEGLEQRQLLAGDLPLLSPNQIPTYDGPRNIGSVQSFPFAETETSNTFGANDSYSTANYVPLGNQSGQHDTIDLTGTLTFGQVTTGGAFRSDVDVFAFDLKAGDILDIATQGAAQSYTLFYGNGQAWYGVDDLQTLYPLDSPLQTEGNAAFAQVIPEDGRYYMEVIASNALQSYTIGLRTYRPVTEQLPVGANQVVFLDFDGHSLPADIFNASIGGGGIPVGGRFFVPSLRDTLTDYGVQVANEAAYQELVRSVIVQTEEIFASIAQTGNNGDFATSGVPGEFGVTILNSEDHPDPGSNPLVSRILIGGSEALFGIGTVGIASNIDIGNFDLTGIAIFENENVFDLATAFPIDPSKSILDGVARSLAAVSAHEMGHLLGMRHTNGDNAQGTLVDEGGSLVSAAYILGVGADGIYGTVDDTEARFLNDRFSANEGLLGNSRFAQEISHVLSTGKVGGSASGRVFRDVNRDGNGTGDVGLAGVTVFTDLNSNGLLDAGESRTVSAADGSFTLPMVIGTDAIVAITPTQYVASTPTSIPVSNGTSGPLNFGFTQVVSDITGTKFLDTDGDGIKDAGEQGIEGVYIYLDLDGDNRPDIGEPSSRTKADGSYSINFPGSGTYTIREVVQPGYVQTLPGQASDYEYTVTYNGIALGDNFDFGNQPSQDYGDAPNTYLTSDSVGGASHGILAGLLLGATVDREADGAPSVGADGDDITGAVGGGGIVIDDEDGVRQVSPFGLGSTGQFEVSVTNTTGAQAYLQGFMDFDGDGTFNGPGEHFAVDRVVSTGLTNSPIIVNVPVPAGAVVGDTYARFRISQSSGIGAAGFVDTGEVEDYRVSILPSSNVANDDMATVSRNSVGNQLFPLANDFETSLNPLTIVSLNNNGTQGTVRVSDDGRSVFYTPKTNFIGRDVFGYTVRDQFGNLNSAGVEVDVTYQSNVPIAVDDIFHIPEGSTKRALNVLDNDLSSLSGGLSIASVVPSGNGSTVEIISGGQSIYYTPPTSGYNGTDQFVYSVIDGAGNTASAEVTVNVLPLSLNDDVVAYSIEFLDPINGTPISNLRLDSTNPALNRFKVRVSVDDLGTINTGNPEGVASAFLDLLFTDELVSTVSTDNNPLFPFDIDFGPLFEGRTFQQGNSQTPGLIDDVGGVQQNLVNPISHTGPAELFTITFEALSPGVAVFSADPADDAQSETVLIGEDVALTDNQLRFGQPILDSVTGNVIGYGNAEFTIFAGDGNYVSAIDDAFMVGVDSDGNVISQGSSSPAVLRVLQNDVFVGATLQEFKQVIEPAQGTLTVNTNGTPSDLNDDYFEYRPNTNAAASGFDQFTYLIVTDDGFRSTAQVTLAYGNANLDDEVNIDMSFVDENGNPISGDSLRVGDRFGVQVNLEDLRASSTFVFAGFLDVLYTANTIRPADTFLVDDFDFDVIIGDEYNRSGAVGTALRAGIIDEFGTFSDRGNAQPGDYDDLNSEPENTLATLFFDVVAPGPISILGSPADSFPYQDTLLFQEDDPVPVSKIRYDALTATVPNVAQGEFIQNPALAPDVNGDNIVSPIDALIVINAMANAATGGAEGESILASKYFYDVNGDQKLSPIDALQVINYLTAHKSIPTASSESEQVAFALPSASADSGSSDVEPSDSVFAELSSGEVKVVSVGDAPASGSLAMPQFEATTSADSDEDDLITLLADDVVGLWG
ncbi:Ig-like domain-containing protein [Novipirellula artificiosorum]|uniref:Uncharacterized protein n=1 Tax=Novipirellula artificiosorum TaxID=2528016 RepID=A0A5C6D991_9BACT|nr:Ig-like domain-containing protein [Novipirellula artificiosorum]TWU33713.1 hypothetical protein Poly41_47090 [Novipirellula artificiosorum]